jgi:hypothetical protein
MIMNFMTMKAEGEGFRVVEAASRYLVTERNSHREMPE